MRVQGFPPISRADARTLILGSMPSRESLAQGRYYAHPRNAFWPILSDLLGLSAADYQMRAEQVRTSGFAIWDVLKTCFRSGSLDSDIDGRTIVTNDFAAFYADHPRICRVFFNGAKAESLYLRHVLPGLAPADADKELRRLPSTSPAHAGMSLAQKKAAWGVILDEGKIEP